jgi:hypothetical protein
VIRPGDVSSDHEMPSWPAAWVKQVVPGKVALALWRGRRRRAIVAGAEALLAAEGGPQPARLPDHAPGAPVVLMPTGPGERRWLPDTLDSLRRYAPEATVVILADGANDLPRAAAEAELPGTVFVRSPVLSGGPPRLSPSIAWGYKWCLEHLDFNLLLKMDVDALLTGPGLFERLADVVAQRPRAGMLGTAAMRDGAIPGDTSFGRWVVASERRFSPTVREADDAARAHGWDGEECHGGIYALTRPALEGLRATGHLDRQPPWWTLVGEDLWFSMGVAGAGLEVVADLPGRPIVSGQARVPLPARQALDEGVLAVHSVKQGIDGEDQETLRAVFRTARS